MPKEAEAANPYTAVRVMGDKDFYELVLYEATHRNIAIALRGNAPKCELSPSGNSAADFLSRLIMVIRDAPIDHEEPLAVGEGTTADMLEGELNRWRAGVPLHYRAHIAHYLDAKPEEVDAFLCDAPRVKRLIASMRAAEQRGAAEGFAALRGEGQ